MVRAPSGLIASPAAAFGWLVAAYSLAAQRLHRGRARNSSHAESHSVDRCGSLGTKTISCARASPARHPPGRHGIRTARHSRNDHERLAHGLDITPVPLASDARRGLGLRQMEAALAAGKDVVIAVGGNRSACSARHRAGPGKLRAAEPLEMVGRGTPAHPARDRACSAVVEAAPSPDAHASAQAMRMRKAALLIAAVAGAR